MTSEPHLRQTYRLPCSLANPDHLRSGPIIALQPKGNNATEVNRTHIPLKSVYSLSSSRSQPGLEPDPTPCYASLRESKVQKLIDGVRKLGLELSAIQIAAFQTYYDELVRWNERVNLTRITDYGEVQLLHFLDSLTVVLGIEQKTLEEGVLKALDVGTGAGFPGIPLKILYPSIDLVLLDSVRKKTEFLHHAVRQLRLDGVTVLWGRAEEVAHNQAYRERFSLVLSRALAPLPTLVELTLPFCALNGRTVLLKKGDITQEMERAGKAVELLGGDAPKLYPVPAQVLPDKRLLVLIDKVTSTPSHLPRRPGLPAKRPLS